MADPNAMMPNMAATIASSPTDMLCAAIKLGQNDNAKSIIAQFPDALHSVDTQDGATPVHWAALFGNVELLDYLIAEKAPFQTSIASSGMQPLHWAATRGNVDVIKLLLSQGCDVNAVDIKQTTALVIAAQYDHTVLVFYLVKHGADISKLDDCQDSALHWAAYKGNLQTAALLHYLGLPADAADSYGSTPMHLAAARNAPHVIEYLIDESTASVAKLVALKDAKGRTPFDVAKERGNALAMRLLLKATPSLRTKLMQFVMGNDGSKVMWFFYIINGSMAYLLVAFYFAPAVGTQLQHMIYLSVNVLMQIAYVRVHCKPPGDVDTGIAGRQKYEEALQMAADGALMDSNSMPLCHTCRIVKPLRSKHCSVRKRCVPMFDHYCPYINNTIGGGNYFEFICFIFWGMFGVIATFAVAVQYLVVVSLKDPVAWFLAVDFGLVSLMALAMNQYHAYLIMHNLTTNEDINKHRYHYLKDDLGHFRNPFSRGRVGNCMELWSRSAVVNGNPYAHSEVYMGFVKNDVEMGELTDTASTEGSDCGDDHTLVHGKAGSGVGSM